MAISLRPALVRLRLVKFRSTKSSSTPTSPKVEEIGSIEQVKADKYPYGQCFIHRTFAYRGVILCSWTAQLLDRNDKKTPRPEMYYQVLIDERDKDHIRVHSDVGQFSEKNKMNNVDFRFIDSGLDQVSHNDIIPYKPTNENPIQHKLFKQYFTVSQTKGEANRAVIPKTELQDWLTRHLPWLHHTQVHKMVADKIRVTAMSLYMGRQRVSHWWRYCIRIENLDSEQVTIQGQRWGIYTSKGELQTIRGVGILGNLPVLSREAPAIQYCSHVTLMSPRGHMWGYYLVKKHVSDRVFLCPVPSFTLESVRVSSTIKT